MFDGNTKNVFLALTGASLGVYFWYKFLKLEDAEVLVNNNSENSSVWSSKY